MVYNGLHSAGQSKQNDVGKTFPARYPDLTGEPETLHASSYQMQVLPRLTSRTLDRSQTFFACFLTGG